MPIVCPAALLSLSDGGDGSVHHKGYCPRGSLSESWWRSVFASWLWSRPAGPDLMGTTESLLQPPRPPSSVSRRATQRWQKRQAKVTPQSPESCLSWLTQLPEAALKEPGSHGCVVVSPASLCCPWRKCSVMPFGDFGWHGPPPKKTQQPDLAAHIHHSWEIG